MQQSRPTARVQSPPPEGLWPTVRVLLGDRRFDRLLLTRLSSQAADGVFQATMLSAVLFNPEKAANAVEIATAFTLLLVPYSVLGPFVGVFLDRWRRARVLTIANLVRAGFVVVTAACLVGFGATVPFYGCALLAIGINRFFLTDLGASLPYVVPSSRLIVANAITTTAGTAMTALGAAAVAVLRPLLGDDNAGNARIAVVAAALYLVSSLIASRFPAVAFGPSTPVRIAISRALADIARGLGAGIRHVAARRQAATALLVIGIHRICYGALTVMLVMVFRRILLEPHGFFRGGFSGATEALLFGGFGALVAAFVTPGAVRRLGSRSWIALCCLAAAAMILAAGIPLTAASLVLGTAGIGFASQGVKLCVDSILQTVVGESYRGRAFSLQDMMFNIATAIGAVGAALILPGDGRSLTLVAVIAAVYLVAALGYRLAAGGTLRFTEASSGAGAPIL